MNIKPTVGVIYFEIVDDTWGNDRRKDIGRRHAATVTRIYQDMMKSIQRPLRPDVEVVRCTKEDAIARYDWNDGIDRFLIETNGTKHSCQDKVLTFPYNTVTFEEYKNSGVPGFWYYGVCQLYGVFYFRNGSTECSNWIVLNFPAVRQARINWKFNRNKTDGRHNPFRYAFFNEMPPDTVVASMQGQFGLFKNPIALDSQPVRYAV